MEILVNGEVKTLEIIDPKTGCHWEQDLLGNADACGYDDDREMPTMSDGDYNWWAEYIAKEQDLQDRAKVVRVDLSDDDQNAFDQAMIDAADNDYEMTQMSQVQVVESWEQKAKK